MTVQLQIHALLQENLQDRTLTTVVIYSDIDSISDIYHFRVILIFMYVMMSEYSEVSRVQVPLNFAPFVRTASRRISIS